MVICSCESREGLFPLLSVWEQIGRYHWKVQTAPAPTSNLPAGPALRVGLGVGLDGRAERVQRNQGERRKGTESGVRGGGSLCFWVQGARHICFRALPTP